MNDINRQAMIFAAGFGKRMLPLTKSIPKPLIKFNNQVLLENLIKKLFKFNVDKIVINTHHLSKKIELFVCKKFNQEITLVHEDIILETGGGLLNALEKKYLDNKVNPTILLNGDIYWVENIEPVFPKLEKYWDSKIMDILMILKKKDDMFGYSGNGDFHFSCGEKAFGCLSNTFGKNEFVYVGLQFLNLDIMRNFKKKKFSLKEVFNYTIKKKRLYGLVDDNEWFHLGTLKDLNDARKIILCR